jgi:Flp pilus assembly protein TadD
MPPVARCGFCPCALPRDFQSFGGGGPRRTRKALFEEGQQAITRGDLARAESAFHRVLAINANDANAHGNLGVIAMKRKRWSTALSELRAAETLAPRNLGIRVNIGLVYYRQNDFRAAIPAFE